MNKTLIAAIAVIIAIPTLLLPSINDDFNVEFKKCYDSGLVYCDRELLSGLIGKGAKINQYDEYGATPLLKLSGKCLFELAEELIAKGANSNLPDKIEGKTPLMYAAICYQCTTCDNAASKMEMVKVLLKHGANINARSKDGFTALMEFAMDDKNYDFVKMLVEKGAAVNAKQFPGGCCGGRTALMYAAIQCQKKNVAYLLSHGATIINEMAVSGEGKSGINKYQTSTMNEVVKAPSYAGVPMQDCLECLEEMLKYEKNRSVKNCALISASAFRNIDMIKVLVQHGAEINGVCSGATPIVSVINSSYNSKFDKVYEIVDYFLEQGADVNAVEKYGWNALMYSASSDQWVELIPLLVSRGADVNKADKNGITPLMIACMTGASAVAEILINKGAKVNARVNEKFIFEKNQWGGGISTEKYSKVISNIVNSNYYIFKENWGGHTPLMLTVKSAKSKCLKLLIDHGADLNARDAAGKTALAYAKKINWSNKDEIVTMLLDAGAKE